MNSFANHWYIDYLACPDCRSNLRLAESNLSCSSCDFSCATSSSILIKPNKPQALTVEFSRTMAFDPIECIGGIDIGRPESTYDGPEASRDSRELLSVMSDYLGSESKVLDLGCGPKDQAIPVEHLGHQYVGVDYSHQNADILADAHALPFRDETFDCVLSYAVLEHLHNPFVAIKEVERILRPGGVYIGTVSQGEPFHDSYFHHTAWGVISLVRSVTSLKINRLWASGDTLASLSRMGRYPKVIKVMLAMIEKLQRHVPFLAPRKMAWPERDKELDKLRKAGSICFVIQKSNGLDFNNK